MALELESPVVQDSAALLDDPWRTDVEGPDPEGGVHHLGPDPFIVEVLDAGLRVVAPEDAGDEVLLLGVDGAGVDAETLLRRAPFGEVAPELLAIDVDGLEVAARILHAAWQALL